MPTDFVEVVSSGLPAETDKSARQAKGTPAFGFAAQVVSATAANILIGILGLITGIISARLLGPHGRGELAAIQTWATCLATIACLGLPEALVYFTARNPGATGRYFTSGALIIFCASFAFVAAGYFVMPLLLSQHSAHAIVCARWYLGFVFFNTLFMLSLAIFRRATLLHIWNGLRLLPVTAWLVLLLATLFTQNADPGRLAIIYLFILVTLFLPVAYFVVKHVRTSFRPGLTQVRQMVGFGLPTSLSVIPQILNCRLDQLLIAGLLAPASLGLYVVAVAWSSIPNPLLYGVATVLFPHVAQLENAKKQRDAFTVGSRLGLLLCLIVSLGLGAVTPWLFVTFFGADFASVVPVALVLVAGNSISGFNLILEEGLRGLGHPKAVMRAELTGMLVMGVALFCLLRPFALLGAAFACLIGYVTVLLVLILHARHLTGRGFSELLVPKAGELSQLVDRLSRMLKSKARGDAAL
jgi:O-antigen/teichoic acid export membrane protein